MDGYAELVDEKVFGNFGAVENAESDDSADSGDEIPDFDLLKQAVDPEGQAEEEAAKKRQQKKIDEREGKYGQLKLSEKTLNEHLQECNRLMKVEDPIDKLFHSKYKAREILVRTY